MVLVYLSIGLPMLCTYLLSSLFVHVGVYDLWYGVSPIMHAFGGFITAWTLYMLMRLHSSRLSLVVIPVWARSAVLLSGVLMIGVVWEWYELILELRTGVNHILGVGDTLLDLTMDGVGALVYSLCVAYIDKK